MQQKILATLQRFWRGFLAFTPGQKAVTVAAVLGLVVGGYLFSSWASKPSYAPLFTNLSASDASGIIDKLNANKTPYQLAANGTEILVPSKDVYSSRLTMSAAGLPSSATSSYSLLDKEGITTSEFKQQVDYQRALEGELDRTIQSISGVQTAAVHLAIPKEDVFNDGSQKPSASVLLTLNPGTVLSSGQVQSVLNLVSSSIPSMTPDEVSVSDSTGKVLAAAGSGVTGTTSDDQKAATDAYNTQAQTKIADILSSLVGPDHYRVQVNGVLNYDKTHSVTNTPVFPSGAPPVAVSSSMETMAPGAGSGSNGVLGATSPTPSAGNRAATGSGGYKSTSNVANYQAGNQSVTTDVAPGALKSQSISVLLDKQYAGSIDLNRVKSLVGDAVGFNPQRDTLTVDAEQMNHSAADAAAAAAKKAASDAAAARSHAQLMSMIKTGAVVLIVLIVVVASLVIGRKRNRREDGDDDLDALLASLNDGSLPPAPKEIVPENREASIHLARQRDLDEMAGSEPEEVARLLRTWLNTKES
ncbi:MAG TPA: flagellar basal-body MS-ring/collar protein FliF [Jatrophihabitans sp.]|nr:flagellar basal-body MS-ring/collar protein FliF [Jatrophihabitans sp.]